MQLFVRGGSSGTVALEASGDSSVDSLKAAFTRKAYGAHVPEAVVLLYNGRQLGDGQRLADAGLMPGATLSACSRLRGGGGDGGSTGAESRSCYLEMYAEKKPDKVNPAEELLARATRCRLSGELLTPPCVADELGSLFNKEALVHALLNKTMPPALAHITSLKAIINLTLTPVSHAPAAAGPGPGSSRGSSSSSSNGKRGSGAASAPQFQCPITGQEMNGRVPFVIHRPSGAVISERALRDVPAAAEELLGGPWARGDLLPVNPTGEELERRQQQLAAALAAERARKQAKKAGKRKDAAAAAAGGGAAAAAAAAGAGAAGGGDGGGGRAAAEAVGSKRGLPPAGPAPAAAGAGGAPAAAAAAAANGVPKKLKVPEGATPAIYASIFSTGKPKMKETYMCRSTTGRGLGM